MALDRAVLLKYLGDNMGLDTTDVDDSTLLFSSSLLDSFSMIDLITFIEQQMNIKLKPTEINLDNLDSIGQILKFITSRKN
jgi:acyl carrier protein